MKYKVDFLETQYSGGQKVIQTIIYDDELDKIITNDVKWFDDLLWKGEFITGKDGKEFSIKSNKLEFMKNLKYAFSGSMLRATDIQKIV